jgi:Transposase IS4
MKVELSSGKTIEIPGTQGFMASILAKCKMSLNRFKQIRGAFHPEHKLDSNGEDDKCYQIRGALNELNAASAANFVPEGNLAFDEGRYYTSFLAVLFGVRVLNPRFHWWYVGGVGCRSRFCPVKMYNKDKPDKFRVDFFILAGSQSYLIHHMDVYQGKNDSNVGVAESCWNLPTTMKAVVNAAVKCNLAKGSNDTNGYRIISLDNRYQCPQLAHLLWSRYVLPPRQGTYFPHTMHTYQNTYILCSCSWFCSSYKQV